MPGSLKNFIKVGMRNPYFVDVKHEDKSVFCSSRLELLNSVTTVAF
jgi:hypothetical protein